LKQLSNEGQQLLDDQNMDHKIYSDVDVYFGTFKRDEKQLYYLSCPTCKKKMKEEDNNQYSCGYCMEQDSV